MEWIQSLNKAIDYIEDNLLRNITCDEVAKHICISTFHFQRTFNLLTDLTISEYIRNRRLSLAGQELTKGNVKVIDIALKYGYETPEGFSKAFSRFHGITPNQAKREGANLKSFNRLVIKIKLEGGNIMDYKIVKKEAIKVVAKTRIFTDENSSIGIPEFWNEYFSSGLDEKVCGAMGICAQEKQKCKEFKYGIGCFDKDVKEVPKGFEVLEIPAYTWAIFKCIGPMPNSIQDMWKRIYSEWLPQAEYELVSDYDIEFYTEGNLQDKDYVSEIWIPVKQK
ncbi:MAG: AraC family transcriptional regulator [Clostridium sp.]|nr:AraC family transcriptional regulator [Clostridium sp.]